MGDGVQCLSLFAFTEYKTSFSLTYLTANPCSFQVTSLVLGSLFHPKGFWSTPARWDSLSLFGCSAVGSLPLDHCVTLS